MIQSLLKQPVYHWWLTALFIATNLLMFAINAIYGEQLTAQYSLAGVPWGANTAWLTFTGDSWRLLSSMWLHSGVIHLATNLWSLYLLGIYAEFYYGRLTYFTIYMFGGLVGSLASAGFNIADSIAVLHGGSPSLMVISVGASGAIMALGAALLVGTLFPKPNLSANHQLTTSTLVMLLGLNIVIGLTTTGVDNAAHIGGACCALGYAIAVRQKQPTQCVLLVLYFLVMCVAGVFILKYCEKIALPLQQLRFIAVQ